MRLLAHIDSCEFCTLAELANPGGYDHDFDRVDDLCIIAQILMLARTISTRGVFRRDEARRSSVDTRERAPSN